MAIKRMTYLELAPKDREASGANALSDLSRMLNVPGISNEHRTQIQARIDTVRAWMNGTLPTDEVKPSGKHHTVIVVEKVGVKEDVRR